MEKLVCIDDVYVSTRHYRAVMERYAPRCRCGGALRLTIDEEVDFEESSPPPWRCERCQVGYEQRHLAELYDLSGTPYDHQWVAERDRNPKTVLGDVEPKTCPRCGQKMLTEQVCYMSFGEGGSAADDVSFTKEVEPALEIPNDESATTTDLVLMDGEIVEWCLCGHRVGRWPGSTFLAKDLWWRVNSNGTPNA